MPPADVFPLKNTDILMFYDTETSGLPLFKEPSKDPRQPRILQLCAYLSDCQGNKLSSMDILCHHPEIASGEFPIDSEAFKAHGISAEHIAKYGIPVDDALFLFLRMAHKATYRIAHNESFDARLVRIAMKQKPSMWSEALCDAWKGAPSFCTANYARGIMRLPPTERMQQTRFKDSFKTPNLGEAYSWATGGKTMQGAHNAMYDVLALKTIFFALAVDAHRAATTEGPGSAPVNNPGPDAVPSPTGAPPADRAEKDADFSPPATIGDDW